MTARTQLCMASTLYGVATLAAAIDEGLIASETGPDGERSRRILLISNNTLLPEVTPAAFDIRGFDLLAERFDRVVYHNEALAPFHPASWEPRTIDQPLWERYFRGLWELGDDDIHLIAESIQVNPAQALAGIFSDATIDIYADGLMSYGPTRTSLPTVVGTRIERMIYPELVPGLTPMLLSEWGVQPVPLPGEAMRTVLAEIAGESDLTGIGDQPVALLLGQYLSALGIVTPAEEENLHLQMLQGAIDLGYRQVVFKPHPSAPRALADSLVRAADQAGVDFSVLTDAALAETLYTRLDVAAVLGCFSTGLITAAAFYRIPVYRVNTELILERLTPYHNSNRVPLTIVDATLPDAARPADGPRLGKDPESVRLLTELVSAVGYVMQPTIYTDRHQRTEVFLTAHFEQFRHYFKRLRLTKLGLPGSLSRLQLPGMSGAALNAARRVRSGVGRRIPSKVIDRLPDQLTDDAPRAIARRLRQRFTE